MNDTSRVQHDEEVVPPDVEASASSLPLPAPLHKEDDKPKPWSKIALGVGLLLVIILGIVLGVTIPKDKSSSSLSKQDKNLEDREYLTARPTAAPTMGSPLDRVINFLVDQRISTAASFVDETTPQYQAALWLAGHFGENSTLTIPDTKLRNGAINGAYHFATRYILSLLWFGNSPSGWLEDANFASPLHHCDWTGSNFIGKVGVICEVPKQGNNPPIISRLQLGTCSIDCCETQQYMTF